MKFFRKSQGLSISFFVLLVFMFLISMGYKYLSAEHCSASVFCGRYIGTIWCQTFGHCDSAGCVSYMKCVYCECVINGEPTVYEDCCDFH